VHFRNWSRPLFWGTVFVVAEAIFVIGIIDGDFIPQG
jgi:hypothetical protein